MTSGSREREPSRRARASPTSWVRAVSSRPITIDETRSVPSRRSRGDEVRLEHARVELLEAGGDEAGHAHVERVEGAVRGHGGDGDDVAGGRVQRSREADAEEDLVLTRGRRRVGEVCAATQLHLQVHPPLAIRLEGHADERRRAVVLRSHAREVDRRSRGQDVRQWIPRPRARASNPRRRAGRNDRDRRRARWPPASARGGRGPRG